MIGAVERIDARALKDVEGDLVRDRSSAARPGGSSAEGIAEIRFTVCHHHKTQTMDVRSRN